MTIPDCSGFPNCPVILNGTTASVLRITSFGTLTVDLGGTLTGAGGNLLIGNGTNNGSLINNGIISGFNNVKNKGDAFFDPVPDDDEPSIVNNGSISCVKFQGGSNEGVGFVTVSAGASIVATGEIHIDSQLTNEGLLKTNRLILHGGVVSGNGTIQTDQVKFDDNQSGTGGLLGTLNILAEDGSCDGENSDSDKINFFSRDGNGNCKNNGANCTFLDLLTTAASFDIDNTVTSCGESAGTALPVILYLLMLRT